MKTACVILAAGQGKRMNSAVPKVLHPVCGVPMLQYVVDSAKQIKPDKILVVGGKHINLIQESVNTKGISFVEQKEPKGTAHALQSIKPTQKFRAQYIVMNGDTPLVSTSTVRRFLTLHRKHKNSLSVLSFVADDPNDYGRIIRNDSGQVVAIVEDRDADTEQKKIREVNSGMYVINHEVMNLLNRIKMNRAKREYYLTDLVAISIQRGFKTAAYCIGAEEEYMGVNTHEELYKANRFMTKKIIRRWIRHGVKFINEDSVFIHSNVGIGKDTIIYPNVYIEGKSKIGRESVIYPNVRIINSSIGNQVTIKDATLIESSRIKDRASIGPFAHIRPGSVVETDAKIGNFVELKKAFIGKRSKASHLAYLGDAKIGRGVNIGAGTITCNFDGEKKHLTVIGDGVFVGSDTQLVAPIKIGKRAYIGAGSTITKDVPAWSLSLSRAEQKKFLNWARKTSKVKNKK